MEFNHYSVMLKETVDGMEISEGGVYVDCTFGGGGHSSLILSRIGNGKLYGFDRDSDAITNGQEKFSDDRLCLINENFSNASRELKERGVFQINGAVIDLGVSSYQLDNPERGFSYRFDAPLDMRMDRRESLTAYDVINGYSKSELIRIFKEYGEERFSPLFASVIEKTREKKPIETTLELCELIRNSAPAKKPSEKMDCVKRIFQSVRIEINAELKVIEQALTDLMDMTVSGGRIAVITFHSLEDKIVKRTFKKFENPCECDPRYPCVCGKEAVGRVITKKPLLPTEDELSENNRSHSAKLRICEKL
ncbi:MAG: 16S rRNA (cytosine(1402)-N(4))-methyltransferase RsmH [Ruminococcaceae bacterium]|nr:16S rRNA (cytosine(1402)-N(4))-methyltransferase RsmH [Oscillospiraceae bacterium]